MSTSDTRIALDDRGGATSTGADATALTTKFLLVAMAVFSALLVVRLAISWRNYGDLDHNAPGTWMALALDARDGTLYRPIVSAVGYGGTRYAPVQILMQAEMLRLGMNPFTSAFILGILATGLVVSGLYVLMRQFSVPRIVAVSFAFLPIAASCIRINILASRGDILPVGLSLWGLWAVVRFGTAEEDKRARWGLAIAGAIFALAVMTKITSFFGIGTAIIWLALNGSRSRTLFLAVSWVLMFGVLLLLVQWISGGRAFEVFRLCLGGGSGISDVLHGPHHLLTDMRHQDPILAILWLLAAGLLIASGDWKSLPGIFLVLATIGTAAIYGSPGVKFNHLADLGAASVLLLSLHCTKLGSRTALTLSAVTLVVIGACYGCWREIGALRGQLIRSEMQAVLDDSAKSSSTGPLLSEDPLLPVMEGQKPYLVDSFMFRTVRFKEPVVADKMWNDLGAHRFSAVVLHSPPSNDIYHNARDGDFGPGFVERVQADYFLYSIHGNFYVFLPKTSHGSQFAQTDIQSQHH
jgi:hypothetical protein